MKLTDKDTYNLIKELEDRIKKADITKLISQKKKLQQNIVPNIVKGILDKRNFEYKRILTNRFEVKTNLGILNIRCCNYYDNSMNKAIMEEEARKTVRYIIVAGHEAKEPPKGIIYFNLTGSKRKSREDLYMKEMIKDEYNRLDTYISSYLPAT